jgi:hypothetical protein
LRSAGRGNGFGRGGRRTGFRVKRCARLASWCISGRLGGPVPGGSLAARFLGRKKNLFEFIDQQARAAGRSADGERGVRSAMHVHPEVTGKLDEPSFDVAESREAQPSRPKELFSFCRVAAKNQAVAAHDNAAAQPLDIRADARSK